MRQVIIKSVDNGYEVKSRSLDQRREELVFEQTGLAACCHQALIATLYWVEDNLSDEPFHQCKLRIICECQEK